MINKEIIKSLKDKNCVIRYKIRANLELEIEWDSEDGVYLCTLHNGMNSIYLGDYDFLSTEYLIEHI